MRKHRKNRREIQRRKKIIMISSILMICILSAGYATFSSNFMVSGKGTIVGPQPGNCFTVSDNGNGTGTITDYDKSCGTSVWIPEKINNLTITKIGDYDEVSSTTFYNKNITSLKLPDTLTYIGNSAFRGLKVANLKMPSALKKIGSRAFEYSYLTSVELNEGLEKIGWAAFEGANLETFKKPSTLKSIGGAVINGNRIVGDDAFVYSINEDGTTNYSNLISYGGILENLTLPENVVYVNSYALGNKYMKVLNIPNNVKSLGTRAVAFAPLLETINIGSGITSIHETAFANNVKTININKKLNSVVGAPWGATNATINWLG